MEIVRAALGIGCLIAAFYCREGVTPTKPDKLRAMRVNPAYLYETAKGAPPKRLAEIAAKAVVADARAAGVETLFVQAYNSQYGAFYPTTYPHTQVEGGLGKQDIFGAILKRAHQSGLQVVAWLPVNDFKKAWTDVPEWRSKRRDGGDYQPLAQVYLLSTWHDGVRDWYRGFLSDLITHYPTLDGIEGAEGKVDINWKGEADFNPAANLKFQQKFPQAHLGDATWKKFRADGLTELHRILGEVAHAHGKSAYVVQTWTPDTQGRLMTSPTLRDATGFDFDGILDLATPGRPDFLAAELIWQQWSDEFHSTTFNPGWTEGAARAFVSRVDKRATPLVHVELTRFGRTEPTLSQFGQALATGLRLSGGTTFYDYHLAKTRGAFPTIHRAYLPGSSYESTVLAHAAGQTPGESHRRS